MAAPTIPDGGSIDGSETLLALQGGKLRRFLLTMLRRRLETVTGAVVGSTGQATITFSPAFVSPPWVQPINAVISNQLYLGVASNVTKTGCTLTFYRTRGTLLLTASAVEVAPAGTSVSAVVFGV